MPKTKVEPPTEAEIRALTLKRLEAEPWREWFEDRTTVIEFDGGVILAQF